GAVEELDGVLVDHLLDRVPVGGDAGAAGDVDLVAELADEPGEGPGLGEQPRRLGPGEAAAADGEPLEADGHARGVGGEVLVVVLGPRLEVGPAAGAEVL